MKYKALEKVIRNHAIQWSGSEPLKIQALPKSGSNRQYFRLHFKDSTQIIAYNPYVKENSAFISFSKHFYNKGLHVARVEYESPDGLFYIVEDLGDYNLYNKVISRDMNSFDQDLIGLYKTALSDLIQFQVDGNDGLNYDLCYPRAEFDEQSIQWDLNYFKYYYLKLDCVSFDEQPLEDDFQSFIRILLENGSSYFMFRDFQSRNIMLRNIKLYYIDYQGGRKGPLQYDVASLLYQAKANLPETIRDQLLEYYLNRLCQRISINKQEFIDRYYAFVLIRTMQVLGAYGYRGFFERKNHFIESIPFAINNLKNILPKLKFLDKLPELHKVIHQIIESNNKYSQLFEGEKLHVSIFSFSYKKGIPQDNSGNGGGFVFDCRALPNPGRYEKYKTSTGKDQDVIDFFADKYEVKDFIERTFTLVSSSVDTYISRNFSHLQISFGCTGGQHRSVFCAENLSKLLAGTYDIEISLKHIEQD